jgi:hypothetical protein
MPPPGPIGGAPADYARLSKSLLWMLATELRCCSIAKTILPQDVKEARTIFSASVAALLKTPHL